MRVLHVDLDAFYAAVEELDNPSLKGKPVAVGGLSSSGVITTANYVARKFGVHSAMPVFMAKKMCPNLLLVPPRRSRYLEKSSQVFKILKEYSDTIEQVSIDEAYLDVTHWKGNTAKEVYRLKEQVESETGLTLSVGMSYNKFLAKIASDWNKPDGFMILSKGDIPDLIKPLSIEKVHGIGPKSAEKLRNLGIETVEGLLELPEDFLVELFGKWGTELYERIRGIDRRAVEPDRVRKSMGVERTFESTSNKEILHNYLERFCLELEGDLIKKGFQAYTISVKIKTEDFVSYTRSKTMAYPLDSVEEIIEISLDLLEQFPKYGKLRLLGVTASNLVSSKMEQISFLESIGEEK